jgi:ABC-type thiamin/hydroxymethylpyrimidine transport system permease subunit
MIKTTKNRLTMRQISIIFNVIFSSTFVRDKLQSFLLFLILKELLNDLAIGIIMFYCICKNS